MPCDSRTEDSVEKMDNSNFNNEIIKESGAVGDDNCSKSIPQLELDDDPYFDNFRPREELDENSIKPRTDLQALNENVSPFDAYFSEEFNATDDALDFPSTTFQDEPNADGFKCLSLNKLIQDPEAPTVEDFGERGGAADSTNINYLDNVNDYLSLYGLISPSEAFTGKFELSGSNLRSPTSDAIFSSSENSRSSLPVTKNPISSDCDVQAGLQDNIVERDQQIKENGTPPNNECCSTEPEQEVTLVTHSEERANEEPEVESKENPVKPDAELQNNTSVHSSPTLTPGGSGERDGVSDFLGGEEESAEKLRQKAVSLIKINRILAHTMNTSLKSLDNQNTEIKLLQQTIASVREQTSRQAEELCTIIGSEALRAIDNMMYYRALINHMASNRNPNNVRGPEMDDLLDIVTSVPSERVGRARRKFRNFLSKMQMKDEARSREEEKKAKRGSSKRAKSGERRARNVRENQAEKCANKQNAKKKAQKRKKKALANDSGSTSENDACSKKVVVPNSSKTSDHALEKSHPKVLPAKQNIKKKAQNQKNKAQGNAESSYEPEACNKKSSLPNSNKDLKEVEPQKFSSEQNLKKKAQKRKKKAQTNDSGSTSENDACNKKVVVPSSSKTPEHDLEKVLPAKQNQKKKAQNQQKKAQDNAEGLELIDEMKKLSESASTSASKADLDELKELIVVLSDFMLDPSADEDKCVAQFKQEQRNDEVPRHRNARKKF